MPFSSLLHFLSPPICCKTLEGQCFLQKSSLPPYHVLAIAGVETVQQAKVYSGSPRLHLDVASEKIALTHGISSRKEQHFCCETHKQDSGLVLQKVAKEKKTNERNQRIRGEGANRMLSLGETGSWCLLWRCQKWSSSRCGWRLAMSQCENTHTRKTVRDRAHGQCSHLSISVSLPDLVTLK